MANNNEQQTQALYTREQLEEMLRRQGSLPQDTMENGVQGLYKQEYSTVSPAPHTHTAPIMQTQVAPVAQTETKKIASVEDFKRISEQVIELVDWDDNGERYSFNVKVKKANMLSMISSGVIPNSLLNKVKYLDNPNRKQMSDEEIASKFNAEEIQHSLDAMHKVAAEVLIQPRYEEIKDYLTDNMVGQLFTYLQKGVKGLDSFRNKQESTRFNPDSGTVPEKTV